MSKKAEAGGERPPSRGRASSRAARHHNAGAQREPPPVPAAVAVAVAAMREGAVGSSSSSAMAARPKRAPNEYVTFREAGTSQQASAHHPGGDGHSPGGQGHGGGEAVDAGKPYYIPPWMRRRERPPEEPRQRVPAERRTTMRPVGAPPMGPRPDGNGVHRTTTKMVERVSTIKDDRAEAHQESQLAPPPGHGHPGSPPPPQQQQHDHDRPTSQAARLPRQHRPWTPTRYSEGKSPIILSPDRRKRRRRPAAFCFTLCCILFWLAVVLIGAAVLAVYLVYRPQPPRLRLTDASLNAGYVDDLTVPGGPPRGLALNADLTVLAAVTSPNTKINVVLWYMQLDLYYQGHMIGTQSMRPAPVREEPGGYVLRSVDIVVSEVPISRANAYAWRNATTHGGPVVLQLAGRFHTQLNFGKWLPYRYWVNPRCTLWLDPPPNGRLRRARC
uniref:Uncharacterized protein n=1 Tax=Avena sativa TaxID=4498 RepID=A0ACD5XFR8_AVESA